MGIRRGLLAIAAAGVLAVAACGGAGAEPTTDAPGGGPHGPPVDLSFTAATVDGGTFDGVTLVGKPAVLWFWAPWCVTCAGQAPYVTRLAEDYADRVTVVGVAGLDDSVENMQRFIDLTEVDTIAHLADVDGVVWQRFEATSQSSFVILDAHGAVVQRGLLNPAEIPDRLDRLVS